MNLESLNSAQRDAVMKTDGPVMIIAGAGSGKTRTLVTRITYLIDEMMVGPYQILALTFSNKAAREMRERVASQVRDLDAGALKITTFHSFCAQVLRAEASYLGLSKNFTIYDETESKAVVKALLGRRGISTKEISPYEILQFIDDIKNKGYYQGGDDGEIDKSSDFYSYYLEYESELARANAVDFGGLITAILQLFDNFPEVLNRYRERYKYVLVDEYQDTNRAQFSLVRKLSEKGRNICIVGDEDQSIYSWRGADIRNIFDFEKVFPEVQKIKLEQNYRSSKVIIEAASFVISKNLMRNDKTLWTDNPDGNPIHIVDCYNEKKEAEFIGKKITQIHRNENIPYSDFAIFYRNNSQSRIIEDYLRRMDLPYRVVGGVKFYDRKEIKDLMAYLRLIVNSKDSLALSRIINVPARGIGAITLRKLEQEAVSIGGSLWDVIDRITSTSPDFSHLKLSQRVQSTLTSLASLINEVKVLDKERSLPSVLYEKILYESGYWDHLKARKDYESLARLENLEEMGSAIKQYEETSQNPSLIGYLETISLDTSNSEAGDDGAHVLAQNSGEISLMTVHGAKGLEFPYVFLTGVEENLFPSYRSLEDGEIGVEEERRLFYVAMTRAMNCLYISFAQGRLLFGQVKFNGPGRFIYEIPEKYCQWEKVRSDEDPRDYSRFSDDEHYLKDPEYDDMPVHRVNHATKEKKVKISDSVSKFPKGSKVTHSLYGKGSVVESHGFGANEQVTIRFIDGTKKRFMIKFAPLTPG